MIGKKGNIWAGKLRVDVKIVDYKFVYGKDRYLVTPVAGEGEVWVEKVNVTEK